MGKEVCIRAVSGRDICFDSAEANPDGVSYVRVVENGEEVAYWDSSEWQEEPELVMGAIMGAFMGKLWT